MWPVLRAELAYFRPWLLGGFGIAAGVVLLVSGVFYAVGDEGPPAHAAAGIRAMFLMMAPLIVGFVVQSLRSEERRTRLLMTGSATPRQLALVAVLLPTIFFLVGALAAAALLVAEGLRSGAWEPEAWNLAGFVGGLLFAGTQIGLLIQETVGASRQGRRRAVVAAWTVFGVLVALQLALSTASLVRGASGSPGWIHLHLFNLFAVLAAGLSSVALFTGRTDFTR